MANELAFYRRLEEKGATVEGLLRALDVPPKSSVVGYTSHMDGFGTDLSDLDVYVYSENISELQVLDSLVAGNLIVDVEYAPVSRLRHLIAEVDACDLNSDGNLPRMGTIKQLYRLAVGVNTGSSSNI